MVYKNGQTNNTVGTMSFAALIVCLLLSVVCTVLMQRLARELPGIDVLKEGSMRRLEEKLIPSIRGGILVATSLKIMNSKADAMRARSNNLYLGTTMTSLGRG